MGEDTITGRMAVLGRGALASRMLDRAFSGLPGGERAIAAGRNLCAQAEQQRRDADDCGARPGGKLRAVDGRGR